MRSTITGNGKMMMRAASVTFFVLTCAAAALIFMGKVYSAVELTAFGRVSDAFSIADKDVFSVFGTKIYIPVMSIGERVSETVSAYAPGMIKLLGFAVNGIEELIRFGLNFFTS